MESKCTHYNPEELEILDFIENENPKSIPDLANKIAKLKTSVKAKMSKKKATNFK
jgi:predicted transcriptional regulator